MKIRSVRVPLFHLDRRTDGQTHMKQLTVVLRNFANVSKEKLWKIYYLFSIYHYLFAFYFCGLVCQCIFWRPLLFDFSGLVWWVTFTIIQWSARIVLIKRLSFITCFDITDYSKISRRKSPFYLYIDNKNVTSRFIYMPLTDPQWPPNIRSKGAAVDGQEPQGRHIFTHNHIH